MAYNHKGQHWAALHILRWAPNKTCCCVGCPVNEPTTILNGVNCQTEINNTWEIATGFCHIQTSNTHTHARAHTHTHARTHTHTHTHIHARGILSRVNHKGLHHGQKQCSVCLLLTLHASHQTTNYPKTTKSVLTQTHIKRKITQTSNKIFEELVPSVLPR